MNDDTQNLDKKIEKLKDIITKNTLKSVELKNEFTDSLKNKNKKEHNRKRNKLQKNSRKKNR